jgi:uncharacterized protein (DUF1330 family)
MAKAYFVVCYRDIKDQSKWEAYAAHDSAGYQEALKALGNGAERDFRVIEGLA